MKYQEKVKRAEEISILLLSGTSKEEAKTILKKEGHYPDDVDKIMRSAMEIIRVKYGDRIKEQMLDGTLEDHLDDYDELSAELFEQIQYEQIEIIQTEARRAVILRYNKGEKLKDIRETVVNNHFTNGHFDAVLEFLDEDKKDKSKDRMIGMGAIVLGIFLSLISKDIMSGGAIFYGLILYGGYKVATA